MNLTPSDKRILVAVSRAKWPWLTLSCLVVIIVCGLVALGLAFMRIVEISQMFRDAGDHRTEADLRRLMTETWICLLIGSTALMSSIFIWITRRFGLLIRKLGETYDAS
jgi:hypothetical protein